jgi:uncharacterized protein HemY
LASWGDNLWDAGKNADAARRFGEARQVAEEVVAKAPTPENCHEAARQLVHCPDPQFRNPKKAIELASRAKRETPQSAVFWSTLGAAYYRAGEWLPGLNALGEATALRQGEHGYDLFFLAMTHRQLGDFDKARDHFQRGCRWVEKNLPGNPALQRLRNEAASCLGLPPAKSLPVKPETPPTKK